VIEMPTERLETISKMVQVLSVVAGVVISVLSFNGAREAEARALQADAEKREVEAAKSFLDLRQRLYLDAVQQAAVLSNPEVHSSQELLAAKKRFRELYVAELSMIEGIGVEEMMKAISIASANDACVAIAEHISATVEGFLELMNERAKALSLDDTHFETVHGLPPTNGNSGDLTSAHDMAVLARELTKYPELLIWSATKEDSLRGGKFILTNTNKLVYQFPGVDGLKTGFHAQAGFNITATAQRDGVRMIAVGLIGLVAGYFPARRASLLDPVHALKLA
jgi:hypothetical protein